MSSSRVREVEAEALTFSYSRPKFSKREPRSTSPDGEHSKRAGRTRESRDAGVDWRGWRCGRELRGELWVPCGRLNARHLLSSPHDRAAASTVRLALPMLFYTHLMPYTLYNFLSSHASVRTRPGAACQGETLLALLPCGSRSRFCGPTTSQPRFFVVKHTIRPSACHLRDPSAPRLTLKAR